MTEQGEGERGQEDPRGHRHRPPGAAPDIADERGEDHQGGRQQAGQCQAIQELAIAHPGALTYSVTLQERDHRIGAAESQQAGLQPGPEQCQDAHAAGGHCRACIPPARQGAQAGQASVFTDLHQHQRDRQAQKSVRQLLAAFARAGMDHPAHGEDEREMHVRKLGQHRCGCDHPQPTILQHVVADADDGAHDQRRHRSLHRREDGAPALELEAMPDVQPRQQHHQHESGQHEAQARHHAAPSATRQRAEIHAQLMCLRPGQHLVHRQHAVELVAVDPAFLIDQFLPDHADLRDRAAPRHRAEAQEAQKHPQQREPRHPARRFAPLWMVNLGLHGGRGDGGRADCRAEAGHPRDCRRSPIASSEGQPRGEPGCLIQSSAAHQARSRCSHCRGDIPRRRRKARDSAAWLEYPVSSAT